MQIRPSYDWITRHNSFETDRMNEWKQTGDDGFEVLLY